MDQWLSLRESRLFRDLTTQEVEEAISCLGEKTVTLKKGEFLYTAGERIEHIGIVLKGEISVLREDEEGARALIAKFGPSAHFGEALCCAGEISPVSVCAETETKLLLLRGDRLLETCVNGCPYHVKLVRNLLSLLAERSLNLQQRMDFLSKKTIRKRLMAYLKHQAKDSHDTFTLPFNREQLADYLCVDRSALSRELSRLQAEGIIAYHKNSFTLPQ